MTLEEMKSEIIQELTLELQNDDTFDETILANKVAHAIREVKRARKYPSSYTDEMIANDLVNYESNVYNIALYEYNQIGMDGESSRSENGVTRTFVNKQRLFEGIIPLAVIV